MSTLSRLLLTLLVACAGSISCAGTPPQAPNVVLIVVDTLRADHLGLYGYSRPTSPELDRLASSGLVFEHAYATSPWTLPTFGSLLTGLYPSAHGAGIGVDETVPDGRSKPTGSGRFLTLRPGARTLAERLAAAGYATGAIVSNPFLEPGFGLDRGFGRYDSFATDNEQNRPADEAVDEAIGWIEEVDDAPFFLLLHFFEPHLQYRAPEPFRGLFTADVGFGGQYPVADLWGIRARAAGIPEPEREFIRAAYDEEVASVDHQIGRLADELARRGVLDDTLVIITADHGEELFDHGGFEHGHALWEELLRVPLVLIGAGVPAERRQTPSSAIDIVPTLLAFAGIEADPALPGIDLLAPGAPQAADGPRPGVRPILAERTLPASERSALVRWPFKVIVGRTGVQLFDLSVDPGERNNLALGDNERARAMVDELAAMISAMGRGAGLAEAQIDERLLERLRALGYLR